MSTYYDKRFKEEAVRLSDELGVKKAAEQLGGPYYTLADWRSKRKQYGEKAYVGSVHTRTAAERASAKLSLNVKTPSYAEQMRF